jgi:predicted CxxxxCH...CXXCH cytochrome family protein
MRKNRCKRGRLQTFMQITLMLTIFTGIIAIFGFAGNAEAQFTVTSCADCHGNPPTESATRNVPAGAVVGSHVKHVTDQGIACTFCHGDTTSGGTDYAHRNGDIEFLAVIHSGSGAYSKGTSTPQTNDLDGSGLGTCSNIYCHSNVQSTNGTAAADTYGTPQWGSGALACDACHGQGADETDGMPASGSHDKHAGSQAGEMNYACSACHNNGGNGNANHANDTLNMDIDNTYGASAAYSQGDHAPGSGGYGSCSSINCHGSGSPAWGTDLSANDSCTNCHGEQAASPTEAQKAPGGAGVDTNGDAAATDAQVGAHQVHMNLSYGYTDQLNAAGNCNECHLVPSAVSDADHIDSALPAEVFPGTINPDKADLDGVSPSYAAGSCTVYCHGATLTGGSDTTPAWNNESLLIGTRTAAADCGVCHAAPPAVAPHTGSETIADCNTCHSHVDTDGSFLNASLHINGAVNASGSCNTCHSYKPDSADGKAYMEVNDSAPAFEEGKGAHIVHVNNIESIYIAGGGSALDPDNDSFGDAKTTAICGVCHNMNPSNHDTDGNGTRDINFNGSVAYQFGSSAPSYNGIPGGAGAVNAKTCSNVSCHFVTTPEWQSY